MPHFWRRVALHCLAAAAVVAAGCADSHGTRDDGGPPPPVDGGGDGAMCRVLPGTVMSMECAVSPSGEAIATITTSPTACCSAGTVTPSVEHGPSSIDVSLVWNACDCCEACRCIGPIQTIDVSLGVLPPGTYAVRSEGATCTLEVGPPPMCHPAEADEARFATVLFDDQPFAATVIDRGPSGCGCTPALAPFDGASLSLDLQLCSCCEACDCIDPGYEASRIGSPLPLGTHPVVIPHGVSQVVVTTRDQCRPLTPAALRIVSPDPSLRQSATQIHWAVVSGSEMLCCAPPAPAVDEGIGPAGERALALYSCVREDCACIGPEVSFEAWHALGDLPAGTHVVRAGPFEATVTVAE